MTTDNQLIRDSIVLNTPTTRRLRRLVEAIATRNHAIDAAVQAILAGDEHALLRLVRSAQAGDQDAATAAIAALLPRMTGTIIKTVPEATRRRAIDEYLSLAFLVIHNVERTERSDHLAKKIVARTKLRYERHVRSLSPRWVQAAVSVDVATASSVTEDEALSRLDLDRLADAVDNGVVSRENWKLVTAAGLGLVEGPLNERQRQTVVRTRRRLADWYTLADAA